MPDFHANVNGATVDMNGSSLTIEFEFDDAKQKLEVPDTNSCWRFPVKFACGHPVCSRPGKPLNVEWKANRHFRPCKLRGCKIHFGVDQVLPRKCPDCDHKEWSDDFKASMKFCDEELKAARAKYSAMSK